VLDSTPQEVTLDTKSERSKSEDTLSADAVPEDAASLLAALGLAAMPTPPSAPVSEASNATATDALGAVSGSAGQGSKTQETLAINTPSSLSVPAQADDQAANFAATLATAEKTVATKTDSTDATADNLSSLPSHVQSNAASHPIQHNSSLSVNTPVRDQNWATDLGQKVVWLANADKQSAQLTLNPPEMGPIEISLDVDKGTASVSFTSTNAEVRDALETALPKLREMFASAGIELGQTNVGAQSFSQQQAGNGERNQSSSRWVSDNAILAADTVGALQTGALNLRHGNGMIDLFA
jgi:flagellar hook-length control protein FliK